MTDKLEFKNKIRVLQLAAIQTDHPYQAENKRYVDYGSNNLYPEFLLDLYLYSPTNNAVIAATSQMIVGGGIIVDETSPLGAQMLSNLITQPKLLKTAFNLKTYGYAVWKITTTDRVIQVEVENSGDWRSGVKDENGNVNNWWYSTDWESSAGKHKPVPYPVFKQSSTNTVEVLILSLPKLGFDYYPPVDYTGGVASIQLESEICEFHLSAIQNGLTPGTIINFNNGTPPEEEQEKLELAVKTKFSGSSNAGKVILCFNDNKDAATTIETMSITDIDKQYEFLSKETTSKILLAHRVTTPLLFGIRDSGGGLGNNANELKDGYIMYYETVIKPYQEIIGTAVLDVLYKNNVSVDITWAEYMPFKQEINQKNTNLSEEVRLNESDVLDVISNLTGKRVNAEGLIELNSKPLIGVPKPSTTLTKLYKFEVIDPNHKNILFKVMEKDAANGTFYKYEDIKDFPKLKGMFWNEYTFKKSDNNG